MKSRFLAPVVLLAAAAVAACGKDPFAVNATREVFADTLVAYALNGAPPAAPAGVNTAFAAVTRVDSSFSFDFAFDFDTAGRLIAIPVSRVGSILGVTRVVGFNFPNVAFDSVRRAPGSGYALDSTRVVEIGKPVVVQAQTPFCTVYDASPVVYSKFIVDSANAASRAVYFRIVTDPNCGFRSFNTGTIPSN